MKMRFKEWFARFVEIMIAVIIALVFLAVLPHRAHAAAVWDVDLHAQHHEDTFSLVGQFTTAGTDLSQGQVISNFSGIYSDKFLTNVPVALVPLGRTVSAGPGLVFVYDNRFFDTFLPDSFDNEGLLLQITGSFRVDYINIFTDITLASYHYDNGMVYSPFIDGSIRLDHLTTSVPEPLIVVLFIAGGLMFCIGRRFEK